MSLDCSARIVVGAQWKQICRKEETQIPITKYNSDTGEPYVLNTTRQRYFVGDREIDITDIEGFLRSVGFEDELFSSDSEKDQVGDQVAGIRIKESTGIELIEIDQINSVIELVRRNLAIVGCDVNPNIYLIQLYSY